MEVFFFFHCANEKEEISVFPPREAAAGEVSSLGPPIPCTYWLNERALGKKAFQSIAKYSSHLISILLNVIQLIPSGVNVQFACDVTGGNKQSTGLTT